MALLAIAITGCATDSSKEQVHSTSSPSDGSGAARHKSREELHQHLRDQVERDATRCKRNREFAQGVFVGRYKGIERDAWHNKLSEKEMPDRRRGVLSAIVDAAYDRPLGNTNEEVAQNATKFGQDAFSTCMDMAR
ncbi:hypothetical protein [Salinisphaera sp.]|uniref:hypothetical protein n=1 Tax=Salinisphaera sp. TaxID=1914330 RepID=UPI0025F53D0B|nr:hypothetical protein [Salinisphaera sp.]